MVEQDQRAAFDGLPSKIAGMVDTADLDRVCSNLGVPSDSVKSARFIRLALAAAAEALQVHLGHGTGLACESHLT